MCDDVFHGAQVLRSVFFPLPEKTCDYAFYVIAFLAWAEALTAIFASYAKRMMRLRTMAIWCNIFGILNGLFSLSLAGLAKHLVNLPLNAKRLREMRCLVSKVRKAAETDLNVEWLKPFMHSRSLKSGSRLFSRGDEAHEAFVLVEGRLEIPEKSVTLSPGALFGEMALFTATGRRTASIVCVSDVRLLVITYEHFEQLYFQNPEFGLYLIRLVVRRFEMNNPD